jgi:RHS repeat-associated protein
VAPDGLDTYTYDSENRLRSAAVGGSTIVSITYDYDPLGRRVSKTVSGTLTAYLLDGDEEVAELSSTGTVLHRYITGPSVDDRIARVDGSAITSPTKFFYHVNHQGSVIDMTDSTGNIQQQLAYDEYGNLTSQSPASPTGEAFRFTGRRFDVETGLYYYRARYYAPQIGRFLQTDPIGYKDDFNMYSYTGDDPTSRTDPSGLESPCVIDNSCFGSQSDPETAGREQAAGRVWESIIPGFGAAEEYERGNTLGAVALGALDFGSLGKGRVIGSLGSRLGRSLAAAGRGALKGLEDTHHIVAKGASNSFAVAARDILEKAGIGIDDAINGIALPKAFHAGLHTLSNYRAIANRLVEAYNRGGADAVKAELEKIGAELSAAAKKAACAVPKPGSRISTC